MSRAPLARTYASGSSSPARSRYAPSSGRPWATSYPANLRRVAQEVDADEWVRILQTADHGKGKPPMPWVNTSLMSERDLRALHACIRGLGPRGTEPPEDVAPGAEPRTPFILMQPQQP